MSKVSTEESFLVVGVGASAGGLEAIQSLLGHLEEDCREHAFIIAQHVSPTYKSMLGQLLSRSTTLPVVEAENDKPVFPGSIYITPPDTEIRIIAGHFSLTKPKNISGPKPSIDILFESIALNFKNRSIGIILSGTGSDGSMGITAIHEVGGLCMVQDPKTSKFDGMPASAIETGIVDLVLAPSEMGKQILSYAKEPHEAKESVDTEDADGQTLQQILWSLSNVKGTDFSAYKKSTILRRLLKRMESLKIKSLSDYKLYLEKHHEEYESLFETILIGVTSFYRDENAFLSIEEHLKTIIANKTKGESIRIWTPGCSTGEEAYSIASIIANILKEKIVHYHIQIFATDIDEKAIAFARKAVYPNTSNFIFKSIEDSSFLIEKEDSFEISKLLRSMILFTKHDLTKNPPFLKLDMVICRNLLIYFNQNLQQQIIPLFHYALNPNGILFLGKSETVGNFSDLFITLDSENKIFQRKRGGAVQNLRFAGIRQNSSIVVRSPVKESLRKDMTVSEMVKETLYNTYDNPYVIISDQYLVEMINGDVNLFLSLPEGQMNANILKMIRPDLQIELRATITKVIKEKESQKSGLLPFTVDGKSYLTNIKVKPLLYTQKNNDLFMVIFELFPNENKAKIAEKSGSKVELQERIEILEKELTATKEHLQIYIEELETTNEELQSLNEEVQSTNEELQSTNEELETSVEELQSTNEEIQIAYTELKASNEELERKDNELKLKESSQTALLNNTLQSFVLTDKNFKILTFNEIAESTFSFLFRQTLSIEKDLREIFLSDAIPNLDLSFASLSKGEVVQGEFKCLDKENRKRQFAYNFTPVLDATKKLSVISFSLLDITATKETEIQLKETEKLLVSIFNAVDIGVCITDQFGRFVNVNQAYCEIYGYSKDELLGKSFTIVVLPEYREAIQSMHDQFIAGEEEIPREWTVQRKNGEVIDIYANAKLLIQEDGTRYKVTSVRDITEKKKFQRLLLETQEATHVGGWEYDLHTQQFSMTQESYHLFNLSQTKAYSMETIAELFNDYEKERLLVHYQSMLANKQPYELLLEYIDHKGQRKWYRAIGAPELNATTFRKVFGSFQDVTDSINFEIEMRKAKELLEQTNETARVGGWEYDLETKKLTWTSVTRDLHEVPEDYIPNVEDAILFYKEGEHRNRIQNLFQKLLLFGTAYDEEFIIVTYKGRERWVRATSQAYFENGVCKRVFGAFQDIHERKMVSEAMRITKERYEFLSQATRQAIWDWDIGEGTVFWGEGYRTNFGFDIENMHLSYETWENLLHPEQREKVIQRVQEAMANPDILTFENQYQLQKADGNFADVIDKALVIRDQTGKAIRMVGAVEDITKRKAGEVQLKLLESVITNSNESVLITEANPVGSIGPNIVFVNAAFTKMTGYTQEEVIGKTPRILQGPNSSPKEISKMREALAKWEPVEVEIINYKKDGSEFWNEFSIFPLANEKGFYTHWIAIERDITRKKREENEKEKLISELTQNNKDLKQFNYITSHNLRAPLSNLSAALSLIEDIPISDPLLSELLKGIKLSTETLNQTIDDLIRILIIKDSPAIEQSALDLETVFQSVLSQIQNIVSSSGASILTQFADVKQIVFNKPYLESIFLNLLTNAIKYRSQERDLHISVKSMESREFYFLVFEDNGLGIDLTRNKDKIFGLYQRFHNLPDSKGLGLYLVKSQLQALGGSIRVESQVNVGTKFIIKIRK
ncbi:PAS domain S-box [Leptospira ryugenii]|uniref:histidine kinase n=1 Tax=Leptospira ryugenii TaxID=1917863 RepID=A0A2P2DVA5_9LEPT|nr:PAS domain S-box protein [Leptospira ryugenii]GBF48544.1 PAS domain S-box [Leptospira ryugenii]